MSGVWSLDEDNDNPEQEDGGDVQVGKRIAVTNLDWDSIGAVDLYALFSSLCSQRSSSMQIEKVEIYPSLFGIERMKRDSLYGPSAEMFKKKSLTDAKIEKIKAKREYQSDDEFELNENADGENLAQLRKYEVNKMKYYYAVIHCNTKKTANRLIEENQGLEFELTNIKLNMSCVADDLEFP